VSTQVWEQQLPNPEVPPRLQRVMSVCPEHELTAQPPEMQVLPVAQALPHWPQFLSLTSKLTQEVPQQLPWVLAGVVHTALLGVDAVHEITVQIPPEHDPPVPQLTPQLPHASGLVEKSTQALLQQVPAAPAASLQLCPSV
jgi:hypothetical protein